MSKGTSTTQLSVNSSQASVHIVHNLIKTSTQTEEMAVTSCKKCAGTRLGTPEAAAGAETKTGCENYCKSGGDFESSLATSPSLVRFAFFFFFLIVSGNLQLLM